MEALGAGESEPVRPAGTTSEPRPAREAQGSGSRAGRSTVAPREGAAGGVAIRVQPGDAEVLIDGERWTGDGEERLVVQLSPGQHQIEVRKDGYRTFMTSVTVRPGETAPLNISLGRQQ